MINRLVFSSYVLKICINIETKMLTLLVAASLYKDITHMTNTAQSGDGKGNLYSFYVLLEVVKYYL